MVAEYSIKDGRTIIKCVDFDGFTDQMRYISKTVNNNLYNRIVDEVSKSDDFYGRHTFSQTLQGMNYGFNNVTEYFIDNIEEIKKYEDEATGIHMDYEGFGYDMGAFVSGVPECCLNMDLPTPTPYIKIMVDLSFPWTYSAEQIYNRGIAITNLVQLLIANKCIIDLYAIEYNIQTDMDIMFTNRIDTKNLAISNIAFMSSPEYFRKIGFITTDTVRRRASEVGRGRSELRPFIVNKIKRDHIFFIGGGYSDEAWCNNSESSQKAIDYLIAKFNTFCEENKIKLTFKSKILDNNK